METTKQNHCPECGKVLDAYSSVTDEKEKASAGDITLCFYCAEILEFTNSLGVKKLDQDKFNKMNVAFKQQILFVKEELLKTKK